MNVTEDMRRAMGKREPVEVTDPDTHEAYVLVKRDQYQAMRRLLKVEEIDPSLYEVDSMHRGSKAAYQFGFTARSRIGRIVQEWTRWLTNG